MFALGSYVSNKIKSSNAKHTINKDLQQEEEEHEFTDIIKFNLIRQILI